MCPNYEDKSFDLRKINSYELYIQINLNGLFFCIFDTELQRQVKIKGFDFSIIINNYKDLCKETKTIIENEAVLKHIFPVCNCCYITSKNIFIPSDIFDKGKLRNYLEFNCILDDLDEIHYNNAPIIDVYSIFAIPSPLVSELRLKFTNIKFFTQSCRPSNYAILKESENVLNVGFFNKFIDLMVVKSGQLALHNNFEIEDYKEALYYIAAVLNKLEIMDKCDIYLSGYVNSNDFDFLSNYFSLNRTNMYTDVYSDLPGLYQ